MQAMDKHAKPCGWTLVSLRPKGQHAVLRSWSGSMFEYLMPTLVMAEPRGSALGEAAHSALREQRASVRACGLPWGQSESAYAVRDQTLAYQYAPQGVARLALRRTPPAEHVVAPYASVLATLVDARAACANLRLLDQDGRKILAESRDLAELRIGQVMQVGRRGQTAHR